MLGEIKYEMFLNLFYYAKIKPFLYLRNIFVKWHTSSRIRSRNVTALQADVLQTYFQFHN